MKNVREPDANRGSVRAMGLIVLSFLLLFGCLSKSDAQDGAGRVLPSAPPDVESSTGWTLAFPSTPPAVEREIAAVEDGRDDPVRLTAHAGNALAEVRARAAVALGRIGGLRGIPLLLRLLEDRDASVRRAAAFGLGESESDDGAKRALRRHLLPAQEMDPGVRALSAEALAKLGGGEEPGRLLSVLRDPDRAVVEAALASLWRLAPEGMAREALDRTREGSPAMRWKAVYALMRLAGAPPSGRTPIPASASLEDDLLDEIRSRCLELTHDPTAAVRLLSARALGSLPSNESVHGLAALRGDPDSRVRVEAARALGRLAATSDAISPFLSDRSRPVRMEAIGSLGSAADSLAAFRSCRPFLSAQEPWAREAALASALRLADRLAEAEPPDPGVPQARELLARLMNDPSWRVRAAAVEAAAGRDSTGGLLWRILPGGPDRWLATEDARVLKLAVAPRLRTVAVTNASLAPGQPLRREVDGWTSHADGILRAMAFDGLISIGSEMRGAPSGSPAAGEGRPPRRTPPGWFAACRDLLARGMKDPSADVRTTILDGIAAWTPLSPSELNLLSGALRDGDPAVRERASRILRDNSIHPPAVVPDRPDRIDAPSPDRLEEVLREVRGIRRATIVTERGVLELDLDPEQAPLTVANFARLARRGYFDDKAWHRVVPDFVAQDGCPRGDGWGGPGYSIRCEINTSRYGTGAVGMALSGKDTGGSQYFITLSPQPHLDGGYTVFGRLRSGWETLLDLAPGDRIERVLVDGER